MEEECQINRRQEKVMQAKADHVAGVFADRGCARRLMLASESAAREDLQLPRDKSCLYISIDGMDQVWGIQSCFNVELSET